MPDVDVNALGTDILAAVRGVVDEDIPELKQFVRDQLEGIAHTTALVAKGLVNGWIDTDEERQHWAATLKSLALEFAKTLRALVILTIERVVNAVIGVVRAVLQAAAGTALPF
jgi:predicted GTPase